MRDPGASEVGSDATRACHGCAAFILLMLVITDYLDQNHH